MPVNATIRYERHAMRDLEYDLIGYSSIFTPHQNCRILPKDAIPQEPHIGGKVKGYLL
jgi:hypothetical protein